ncbi:MAG: hypothetical protein ACE5EC_10600 [Phycisphaerae bacterium]
MSSRPVTIRNLILIAAVFVFLGVSAGGDPSIQPKPDNSKTEKKAASDSEPRPTTQAPADDDQPDKDQAKTEKVEPKPKNPSPDPKPRRVPSYSEILKELQKETRGPGRIVVPKRDPSRSLNRSISIDPGPNNAIQPVERKLLPDGARIVDRPGRLTREGNVFTFSFESRGRGAPELPIRLLPNRLLEDMEIFSDGGQRPIVFIISGEITEYRGVNYLLLQKLLVRPDMGNLK